jgi:hypothetical protein
LFVRGEQGFEALAQRGIAFAHGVQKCRALVRRLFQRQGKQGFFAGGIQGCLTSVFSFASAAAISSQDGHESRRCGRAAPGFPSMCLYPKSGWTDRPPLLNSPIQTAKDTKYAKGKAVEMKSQFSS